MEEHHISKIKSPLNLQFQCDIQSNQMLMKILRPESIVSQMELLDPWRKLDESTMNLNFASSLAGPLPRMCNIRVNFDCQ